MADIELSVADGERLGLIGPNGSGKSTLVNCLCGTLRNETGQVRFAGQSLNGLAAHQRTRLGMARSFQLPRPFPTPDLGRECAGADPVRGQMRDGGAGRRRRDSGAVSCLTWSA